MIRDRGEAGIFFYVFDTPEPVGPDFMIDAGGRAVASRDGFRPWCDQQGVDFVLIGRAQSRFGDYDWRSHMVVPRDANAAYALKLRWL